jgi:hypothetical protein
MKTYSALGGDAAGAAAGTDAGAVAGGAGSAGSAGAEGAEGADADGPENAAAKLRPLSMADLQIAMQSVLPTGETTSAYQQQEEQAERRGAGRGADVNSALAEVRSYE